MAIIQQETAFIYPRLILANFIMFFLPAYSFNHTRAIILHLAGFKIELNSLFADAPKLIGPRGSKKNLVIGSRCWFGPGCFFDLADTITIGNHVTVGPENLLITGTHRFGPPEHRAGKLDPRPVKIMDGAWLGARVIVLPGVTIGPGTVVGAGAVVTRDLPANTVCAGIPARVIRDLDSNSDSVK